MLYDTDTKSLAILVRISGDPAAFTLTVSASSKLKTFIFWYNSTAQKTINGEILCEYFHDNNWEIARKKITVLNIINDDRR